VGSTRPGRSEPHTLNRMSNCLSPPCRGDVVAETATDGLCDGCGLHHRRPKGVLNWDEIVGPVAVTLFGAAGEPRTTSGFEEVIEADSLRFKGAMRIRVTRGTSTLVATVPRSRLVGIIARD
jgi:hypothetical protein